MKNDSPDGRDDLLVEIRVEDLPPNLLVDLATRFRDSLLESMRKNGFADSESEILDSQKLFATPRRLAVVLTRIRARSESKIIERKGPQKTAAYDEAGAPTRALTGFLRGAGAKPSGVFLRTEKGREYVFCRVIEKGKSLRSALAGIVDQVLESLVAPRRMRWNDSGRKFARPIRGVLLLHGAQLVKGEVMGVKTTSETIGHRAMSGGEIKIENAAQYEKAMRKGEVVVDFYERRKIVSSKIEGYLSAPEMRKRSIEPVEYDAAGDPASVYNEDGVLLNEVAAMTENPFVFPAKISEQFFRALPSFVISSCLREHQKCFPLAVGGKADNLILNFPEFLFVADNRPKDSAAMIRGFESVARARLRDAQFYVETDIKNIAAVGEEKFLDKLSGIVYHRKLGSQKERAERLAFIASRIAVAAELRGSETIEEAARYYLASLPTLMVEEYPKLQGAMAGFYFPEKIIDFNWGISDPTSESDGINWPPLSSSMDENADTDIKKQLDPQKELLAFCRFCHDLENLVAMFGVGEKPSGGKDPRGLRVAAKNLAHSMMADRNFHKATSAIQFAQESFKGKIDDAQGEVYDFILERIRAKIVANLDSRRYQYARESTDAALSKKPDTFRNFMPRVCALCVWRSNPKSGAETLVAANKRINNIFRKSGISPDSPPIGDPSILVEKEEIDLLAVASEVSKKIEDEIRLAEQAVGLDSESRFASALSELSAMAPVVDSFFDKILVNAEDEKIRANRFALLAQVRDALNQIADLSKLPG